MAKEFGWQLEFAGMQGEYYLAREEAQQSSWLGEVASVFDTDQPQETYPWIGQVPKLRKYTGERTKQELREDVITIVNDDYEVGFECPLKAWRRDKTGQIRVKAAEMADETVEHPMALTGQLLLANGNAYDSTPYFSTSHAVGGVTLNNNILAADGLAGGASPTVAQQAANIQLLLQRMLAFRGDKGHPLNRRAKSFLLMIPTNMLGATIGALKDDYVANGQSNTLRGIQSFGYTWSVVTNPDLDGTTNQLYMFRTDGRIKPFIYQEEIVNVAGLGEGSEYAHMNGKVRFDIDMTCGAGYGRFEFAIRGTTS